MSFIAIRRRVLILLVPAINFLFIFLFIFSPSSLPRLPRNLSVLPKPGTRFSQKQTDPLKQGYDPSSPGAAPDAMSGAAYLMEQRKQVQGIRLTPLQDNLISTYQPGYLGALTAAAAATEPASALPSDPPSPPAYDIDKDPSTKYLTFLPHSGFHNQRTELENALLLARLLNRTLIMPKVYLGPPMPWLTFRNLHSRLLYQTKIGLDHCRAIIELQEVEDVPEEEPGQEGESPLGSTPPLRKEHYQNMDQLPVPPQPVEQQQQQHPPQPPPSPPQQPELQNHHHHNQSTQNQPKSPVMQSAEDLISPVPQEVLSLEDQIRAEKEDRERAWRDMGDSEMPLDPDMPSEGDAEEQMDDESREETDLQSDYSASLNDDPVVSIDEEDDSDDMTSWIEEPDDEEEDEEEELEVATGDSPQDILDFELDQSGEEYEPEVEDWGTVKEGEEGEGEEEEGTNFGELPIGIEEDDDEEEDEMELAARRYRKNWGQDPFSLPIQKGQPRRARGRQLAQMADSDVAWPLYLPVDSALRESKPHLWKRSSLDEDPEGQLQEQATGSRFQKRQLPKQLPPQAPHQPIVPPSPIPAANKLRRQFKWSALPAECLQYESWTMTDWDLFFNLDPLRRYVRILTRESMSMAYLESRFNITLPKEVEPAPNNSTSNGTVSADGSDAALESETSGEEDNGDTNEETEEEETEEEEIEEKVVPLLRTAGDVLFFDDSNLYDYRFTENPDDPESLITRAKFDQEFSIEAMRDRPERLIHLGSIFGTGRVSIESLESKAWLLTIKDHLILRTEILQTTSQRIANRISGLAHSEEGKGIAPGEQRPKKDPMESGFVGIHIRMSDGHFSLSARDTIENIRQELLWQTGITEGSGDGLGSAETGASPNAGSDPSYNVPPAQRKQGRLSIEQCRARALNHHESLKLFQEQQQQEKQQRQQQDQENPISPQAQQQQQQQPTFSHRTVGSNASPSRRRSNGRYTPIYLATDAHRPRANPIFDKLFQSFDCIFTLDDFAEDLEPLHQFRNPEDGTLMAGFLIPMVDAMVVAKAAAFFGTPTSTFSHYIQKQLRPAYTGLFD